MRVIEHNHFSPKPTSNGLPTPLFPPLFPSVSDHPPSAPAFFLISQLLGFHIALFHVSSTRRRSAGLRPGISAVRQHSITPLLHHSILQLVKEQRRLPQPGS